MRVINHKLMQTDGSPVRYEPSPNVSKNRTIVPRFLIIHYTAGSSLQSTINWFLNPDAKASSHLLIGRTGETVQMASFNRRAWHAGLSSWGEINDLNSHSIGIELDNAGEMIQLSDGTWRSSFGRKYPDDEVFMGPHQHDDLNAPESGWHDYTEVQLQACFDAAAALHAKYNFDAVLGHDDISPGRKRDPGPAFAMEAFRARLFGRRTEG